MSENTAVFKGTGAEAHDALARDLGILPPGAWVLSHSISRPCEAFFGASVLGSWIVQVTHPLSLRWHKLDEQCSMNKDVLYYFSSERTWVGPFF